MGYVYVVTSTMGDDVWAVHEAHSDKRKANKLKEKLEKDGRVTAEVHKLWLRK